MLGREQNVTAGQRNPMRQTGPEALPLRSGLGSERTDEPVENESGPADPNDCIENHSHVRTVVSRTFV